MSISCSTNSACTWGFAHLSCVVLPIHVDIMLSDLDSSQGQTRHIVSSHRYLAPCALCFASSCRDLCRQEGSGSRTFGDPHIKYIFPHAVFCSPCAVGFRFDFAHLCLSDVSFDQVAPQISCKESGCISLLYPCVFCPSTCLSKKVPPEAAADFDRSHGTAVPRSDWAEGINTNWHRIDRTCALGTRKCL